MKDKEKYYKDLIESVLNDKEFCKKFDEKIKDFIRNYLINDIKAKLVQDLAGILKREFVDGLYPEEKLKEDIKNEIMEIIKEWIDKHLTRKFINKIINKYFDNKKIKK